MRARLVRRLDHLVDNMLRRCAVRITHAEVDDVFAALTRRRLQLAGYVEDIGRKAFDSRKFVAHNVSIFPREAGGLGWDRFISMENSSGMLMIPVPGLLNFAFFFVISQLSGSPASLLAGVKGSGEICFSTYLGL